MDNPFMVFGGRGSGEGVFLMALDRFVNFPKGKKGPTKDEIGLVLKNFLGGIGDVSWSDDRWIVSLPGKPTWTFEGLEPDMMPRMQNSERWIEVYVGPTLDVITRSADEFTNALAVRIAQIFARYWEGKVDK